MQATIGSKPQQALFGPDGRLIPQAPNPKDGSFVPLKRHTDASVDPLGKRQKSEGVLSEVTGEGKRLAPHIARHKVVEPVKAVTDNTMTTENLSQVIKNNNFVLMFSKIASMQRQCAPGASSSYGHARHLRALRVSKEQGNVDARREVPSWFSMGAIADREKEAVPEFFNGRYDFGRRFQAVFDEASSFNVESGARTRHPDITKSCGT